MALQATVVVEVVATAAAVETLAVITGVILITETATGIKLIFSIKNSLNLFGLIKLLRA
mgnify:CR=1 FL=1